MADLASGEFIVNSLPHNRLMRVKPGTENSDRIDYITSCYKWQRVESSNPDAAPSPRQWFSMTLFRRALYIFGGIDNKKNITNDFYRFDIGR